MISWKFNTQLLSSGKFSYATSTTKRRTVAPMKKKRIKPKANRDDELVDANLPVTQQMASALDLLSVDEQAQVGEALGKTMVSLMKIEKGKRAETIHESIDEVMAAHNKQDQDVISCKKGCSHCCQQMVFITDDEATLLLQTMLPEENSTLSPQVLSYLKEQAKYDTATIFDFWRLPKEQSACVFLKDDLCSVYAKRPAGCRTLQVTSDPQKCSKSESLHQEINKKIVVPAEIIASAALALPKTEYEPMPILLLKKYEEFKRTGVLS